MITSRGIANRVRAGAHWACCQLPSLEHRSVSTAFIESGHTRLGKAITPQTEAHPGTSGIYMLSDARDAFAARVLLARAAERTLDVRYYIWHHDTSGSLLMEALREAADRGVRVRLLLDDNGTSALDERLAALDAHRNIEVRLFNPFVIRKPRLLGYLTDFHRLNRRMHNKSFTADNQATIIGGRNVGDEYFGATNGVLFVDLDVMAVGPVVQDVSGDFDRYWASDSSYPVHRLLRLTDPALLRRTAPSSMQAERDPAGEAYTREIRDSSFARDLTEGRLPLEWAPTHMVSDDPLKGLGLAPPDLLLPSMLKTIIGEPAHQIDLVSAYFVPTAAGVASLVTMAERGVAVRVLTNSLRATDVPIVHAAYAKWRKPLLEAGVLLYELRQSPSTIAARRHTGPFGSSGSSLHAKTFSVDRSRVFVGSFNFDPRSAKLNTEMGFIIDSPALAARVEEKLSRGLLTNAFEVRLSSSGKIQWIEHLEGQRRCHHIEPGTSLWQRGLIRFLSLLPIEWML
jgi:cardiolipin synthase C